MKKAKHELNKIDAGEIISADLELPFFPQYETESVFEGIIRVTWFEPNFSQSHYNVHGSDIASNACTLIVLLMARKSHEYNVIVTKPTESLNIRLIHLLAISMLEGNKIHEELRTDNALKHLNMTVPEALRCIKNDHFNIVEWKCNVYLDGLAQSLYGNIKKPYLERLKGNIDANSNLYVILIAESRTVLFILQPKTNTITLIDSHQHAHNRGAFIAIADTIHLASLCFWYADILKRYHNITPKLYELSFIYIENRK